MPWFRRPDPAAEVGPILRATPEEGETWDDPSEDLLFMLFEDIEEGQAGSFLIVERLTDPNGQTYGQVLRHDDGSYTVEYRDGGADRHWGTGAVDFRAAHELLTAWAFERDGWRELATWEQVEF